MTTHKQQSLRTASVDSTRAITRGDKQSWIQDKAKRCVISQGYSQETADAFATWVKDYCPEVQSFSNLFDCYMSQQG